MCYKNSVLSPSHLNLIGNIDFDNSQVFTNHWISTNKHHGAEVSGNFTG